MVHALIPAVGTRSCPVLKQDMKVALKEDTSTRFPVASKFLPELRKGLLNQGLQLTPNKGLPLWCKVQAIIEQLCLPV